MTPLSEENRGIGMHPAVKVLIALLALPAVLMWMPGGSDLVVRATASPQPALVSDQAASRLAPTGLDQAQGRGQ